MVGLEIQNSKLQIPNKFKIQNWNLGRGKRARNHEGTKARRHGVTLGQDQKDMDVVYPGASPFSVFLDKGLEHSFLFGGIRHPG